MNLHRLINEEKSTIIKQKIVVHLVLLVLKIRGIFTYPSHLWLTCIFHSVGITPVHLIV